MPPSAVTTANTAFPDPSGDRPSSAVPTAPVAREPGMTWLGRRPDRLPAYTPPVTGFGAPANGSPVGSKIDDEPIPSSWYGALAGHSRPKALLIERPNG